MKKIHKADILLLGGLLLAGLIICGIILVTGHRGATVEVSVGGEVVKTFALDRDTSYTIEGGGRRYQ